MCVLDLFLRRQSCVFFLSSCLVWGWLLLASSGVASVPLPGAPAVFRGVSCSWLPLAGSATFWLLLAGLLLQWTFVVGLAVSWYTTWFSTLCLRSFPCSSLPLTGFATFLAPVCWPTPAVEPCCWVGDVYGASLGSLPCAVLFPRSLQFAQLTLLQVQLGIFCLFCHRVPVLLLPWWRRLTGYPSLLFSGLLLLRLACRGSLGSAPCVRVL